MPDARCECGNGLTVSADNPKPLKCPSCGATVVPVYADFSDNPMPFDATLTIKRGPQNQGRVYLMRGPGPIEVGKRSRRHITLKGGVKVSRHHCNLVRDAKGWGIVDRNSTHGVVVRSEKVEKARLKDGDVIWLGEFKLQFNTSASPSAPKKDSSEPAEVQAVSESEDSSSPIDMEGEDSAEMTADLTVQGEKSPDLDLTREPGAVNVAQPFEPPPPPDDVEAPELPLEKADEDDEEEEEPEPSALAYHIERGVGAQCPKCGSPMQSKAVLCTNCGFDVTAGRAVGKTEAEQVKADVLGEDLPPAQSMVLRDGMFRFKQVAVPSILIGLGLVIHAIVHRSVATYLELDLSTATVVTKVLSRAFLGAAIGSAVCLMLAYIMGIKMGPIQTALFKFTASSIAPGAVLVGLTAAFIGSPDLGRYVIWAAMGVCYFGLLKWLLDLDLIEASLMTVLMALANLLVVPMVLGSLFQ